MTRRMTADVLATLGVVTALAAARAQAPAADGRDADRAAIRAHIESICQAFLDGDVRQDPRDAYRRLARLPRELAHAHQGHRRLHARQRHSVAAAGGRRAAAPARPIRRARSRSSTSTSTSTPPTSPSPTSTVDFGQKSGTVFTTGTRYRIMDIYVRRKGEWNQAASHTVIDPAWRAEQMTRPGTLRAGRARTAARRARSGVARLLHERPGAARQARSRATPSCWRDRSRSPSRRRRRSSNPPAARRSAATS